MPRVRVLYLAAIVALFAACSETANPAQPSGNGFSDSAFVQSAAEAAQSSMVGESGPHGRTIHTLTGSAVHNPDFGPLGHATYRETVAARTYEDGTADGTSVIDGDFSGYGLGLARFTTTIDCLSVVGNVAWYTGTVTETNNTALAPVGAAAIGQFVDNGQLDHVHSGPLLAFAAPGTTCRARPSLPLFLTSNGTYTVR